MKEKTADRNKEEIIEELKRVLERPRFWTYKEIANLLKVTPGTIRAYVTRGELKPFAYKNMGKGRKIALVTEEEVLKLIYKKLIFPPIPFHRCPK